MWSDQEIKNMQAGASARQTEREKAKQGLMLDSALKQTAAKQTGEENLKRMDINANADKVASEAAYNNSAAKNVDATTDAKKLETSTASKLAPSAVDAGVAGNKSDAFASSLSLAKNKRSAMGEIFAVDSPTNKVGLNDSEVSKHLNDQDKQNEAEIAASKRNAGVGTAARPRKSYNAPFTGGIFN